VGVESNLAVTRLLGASIQQYDGAGCGDRAYNLYSDTGATYGPGDS
jgi:hypothetical protein